MRFGGLIAVDALSFAARRGEITAVIGPNGAGKTTRVQLHHRLLPAERRRHRAAPRRTAAGSRCRRLPGHRIARRARVARTFQNIRLFAG